MDYIRNNKDKLILLPFYLGLTMELVILLVDKSVLVNPIEGQLFRITFLLFSIKICFTRYSIKEWLWIIAFGVLGFISYRCTGRNDILRIVVFAAAMKDMELIKVLKYVLWVTLTGCLLIVLLSLAGVMGDISIAQEYRAGIIENRYCFGMGHPNAVHCMFLMVVLLILYVYESKINNFIFAGLFLGNLFLFYFTGSKTGLGVTAIAVMMAFVLSKGVKLQKAVWVYLLGILVFAGCIGISVWAAKYSINSWSDPMLEKIDALFSGRMKNLYWDTEAHAGALETWSLFAAPINKLFYFDMGWVRLFYWYGIIPGSIFVILIILLIWECFKKKDYMGLAMIIALAVYTIVEAHIISVYIARNYILFLIGVYWSDMLYAGSERQEYWWKAYRLFRKEYSGEAV